MIYDFSLFLSLYIYPCCPNSHFCILRIKNPVEREFCCCERLNFFPLGAMAGASEKEKESEREQGLPSLRPLHNFTLPSRLKWGAQRQLRCRKVPDPHSWPTRYISLNSTTPSFDHHRERSNSPVSVRRGSLIATLPVSVAAGSVGNTTGIEAVREKLMSDLTVAADQTKLPVLEDKRKDINKNDKKPSEEELPWNLRTRRPAGKASSEGGNVGSSPFQRQERGPRSLLASDKGEASDSDDQRRPRFSHALSKEEIETDFLLMTGAKPPRRPKRRPKAVQKQIDASFPGSWLTEVTPDIYKVPEASESKGEK